MSEAPPATKPAPIWKNPTVGRLLLVALLAEIGYAVLNISTMPVYLSFDRNFGASSAVYVFCGFLVAEAAMKGPMGHFADRLGSRKLMMIAPLLTVGTSILSFFIPHFDPKVGEPVEVLLFILLRLIDGVGAAMLWPAAFALMGNSVSDAKRQEAMSLLNMCYLVAVALALPIGGIVEDTTASTLGKLGLGSHAGGIILAAVLFGLVFVTITRVVHVDAKPTHDESHGGGGLRDLLQTWKQIPSYLLLAMLTFAGIGFPMGIIKIIAQDEFKLSATQFGALVMPGAIAMAIFSVPISKVGERIGRARAVHIGMFACAIGITVISLGAFFSFFRSPWMLALGGIPVGLGFLLTIPAWLASVSDIDPSKRAANIGAVMTAQGVGAMIGAPLGGNAYEKLVPVGERLGLGAHFGHFSPFIGTTICIWLAWAIGLRILKDPR